MQNYQTIFFLFGINSVLFSSVPDALLFIIHDTKKDRKKIRDTLESIDEYVALEVLNACRKKFLSIIGESATHFLCDTMPILTTILRARLPLHRGIYKIFRLSEVGFFAISRNEETLKSKIQYSSLPNLKDRYVILSDTLLATGGSIILIESCRIIILKKYL